MNAVLVNVILLQGVILVFLSAARHCAECHSTERHSASVIMLS
jgi:hypothetical protein